ncbi:MAG: aspartate kinase [Patescibacteria group bacterium]|nr:aspartate kinase [Patescibacteria group bacterium]
MNKEIVVQKYGGESIADFEKMRKVAEHIVKVAQTGKKVVVVISAMGKTTDQLIQLARQVFGGEPPRDELDNLLATGEQQAASLLAITIRALGMEAISLTGWQIGLETDSNGRVKRVRKSSVIEEFLAQGKIPIVAGFQGNIEGTDRIITLGRGGSDATAVALAASLGLDECELYKDVDGIYTIDPDVVPNAKRFSTITYSHMAQLASAGAKVIMARAVALAQNLGVKIKVLLSPSIGQTTGGTLIYSGSTLEEMERFWFQPAIAIRKRVLFKISNVSNQPGIAAVIFHPLREINLGDSIQGTGETTAEINLISSPEDRLHVLAGLERVKKKGVAGGITIFELSDIVQLTIVSPLMAEEPGYLARIFESLGNVRVNIEALGSSGNTIWVAVKKDSLKEAAQALAKEFDLLSNE